MGMLKKTFLLMGLLFFTGLNTFSQTADDYVRKAETAIKNMDETNAFKYYKLALQKDESHLDALCGASLLCSRIGNRQSKESIKISFFKASKNYAVKALNINPNLDEANYVMAVAMGRMALISGAKDKVAASRDIYKYINKAIKINSKHAGAWHVLGKYYFEVANLNFAERGAANLLFGGLPEGSISQAISCYEKCLALDPAYLINYLELAKAYKQSNQKSKAKALLETGLNKPNKQQDDTSTKADMRKLLTTL